MANLRKEAAKIKAAGKRNSPGDTELIHASKEEVALLKNRGGSGRIDPVTGLRHFESGVSAGRTDRGGMTGGGGDSGGGGGGGDDGGGGGERGYATTKLDPNVQAALQAQTSLAKDVAPSMQSYGMADPNSIRQSQNLAMGVGGQSGLSGAGYGFDFNKGITASNLANDPNAGYGYSSMGSPLSAAKAALQGLGLMGTMTAAFAGMPISAPMAVSSLRKGYGMVKNFNDFSSGGVYSQGMGIDNSGANLQGPSGMGGAGGSDGYASQQMAGFNRSTGNPGGLSNQGFQNGLLGLSLADLFGGFGGFGGNYAQPYQPSQQQIQQPLTVNVQGADNNAQNAQNAQPTSNFMASNGAPANQSSQFNPFAMSNFML